ncbi:hypothetical protein O181_022327 [Austropuccinia psidii MF-1]|uniref:Uncharacterized protein n=1 Tax=Austropuccinia psidii MF-1 TaxID=1389203 RepID=A0A9Q3CHA6_9BASI|nr:hypothetical protein [Austropuccinia psidii MF-1]
MVVIGQKWVLRVFMAILGQDWLRWAQLALEANGIPPFGLIGLGQKGPKWPTDRGIWTVDRDYGPQTVEAVGGLNGPKRPFRP